MGVVRYLQPLGHVSPLHGLGSDQVSDPLRDVGQRGNDIRAADRRQPQRRSQLSIAQDPISVRTKSVLTQGLD